MSDSCNVPYGICALLQAGYEFRIANGPGVHTNEYDEWEEVKPDRNVDPSEDLIYKVHDSLRDRS